MLVAPVVLVQADPTIDNPDVSPVDGTEALRHPLAPKTLKKPFQSRSAPRENNHSGVDVRDDSIHDHITRFVGCGGPDAKHIRERAQANLMKQAVEPNPETKIRGQCLTKPSVDSSDIRLQSAENPLESGLTHPKVLDPVLLSPALQRHMHFVSQEFSGLTSKSEDPQVPQTAKLPQCTEKHSHT